MDEQLLQSFFTEASESMVLLEESLQQLEDSPDDRESIDAVFRVIHTIKGNSSFLDLDNITSLTHLAETLLDEARNNKREVDEDLVQACFLVLDDLRQMILNQVVDHDASGTRALLQDMLDDGAGSAAAAGGGQSTGQSAEQSTGQSESVSAGADSAVKSTEAEAALAEPKQSVVDDLASFLEEAVAEAKGELVQAGMQSQGAATQTAAGSGGGVTAGAESNTAKAAADSRPVVKKTAMIRIEEAKLNKLVDLVNELEVVRYTLEGLPVELEPVRSRVTEAMFELDSSISKVNRITTALNRIVYSARLVPVNTVFKRFPRVVRDLAKKLGKDIELVVKNGSAELDKTIVEAIADPMTHMIRNACDHGIESAEDRKQAGKPAKGTVTLNSYVEDNYVVISISDDGKGIDGDKMVQVAHKKGILGPDKGAGMSLQEKMGLIFAPGFSSASEVTDISGRGVGMDVVKQNINKLKGTVVIESEVGKGSTFLLRFPLSMTVMRSLFVRTNNTTLAVPLTSIEHSTDYKPEEIVQARTKAQNDFIPLYFLDQVFWGAHKETTQFGRDKGNRVGFMADQLFHAIVARSKDGRAVAFQVQSFDHIEQVVVHSVDSYISSIPGVQGAVVLRDGTVAMTLNIEDLIEVTSTMKPFGYAPLRDETEGAENTLYAFLQMSSEDGGITTKENDIVNELGLSTGKPKAS